MSEMVERTKIPDDMLAELWFGFVHEIIGALQAAHRESGLTYKAIGTRLGWQPEYVSLCLSGQHQMTIREMHDLARGMGYRLSAALSPSREDEGK